MNNDRTIDKPSSTTVSIWRHFGIAVQAVVLGTLLFMALVSLFSYGAGAQIFRYQAF